MKISLFSGYNVREGILGVGLAVLLIMLSWEMLPAQEAMSGNAGDQFLADYNALLKDPTEKLVSLAEAMPAEKYSWRPEEGVRSVSEVYVHVAASSYYFLKSIGFEPPVDLGRDAEKKITDKKQVLDVLKNAMDFVKTSATQVRAADLNKKIKMFGQEMDVRSVLMALSGHLHEHLGQSIAYARTNAVTPPWSKKMGK